MARLRRTSPALETFQHRLAGLKSINPAPDFGSSLTMAAYEAKGVGFRTRLNGYNQKIAELDDEQNGVDSDEDELQDFNRRMLSAVEGQYGPDSSEYEAVGGTRKSERKRPTRKGGGATPPA
jgi:hypothetical protein